MRISTIFGTSLTLASGILIGWTISGITHPTPQPKAPIPAEPIAEAPHPVTPKRNPDLQQAERLLNASRSLEALAILSRIAPTIDLNSYDGMEWLRLVVDAYAATDNRQQLVLIFKQFPEAFAFNEQAALAVAEAMMEAEKMPEYHLARNQWKGKERQHPRWVFLDVQEKMLEGKKEEAALLLKANRFNGKNETDRLVRLAALYVVNDPKLAWNYLSEASLIDPLNSDIHTFKASLGEALQQNRTAHSDYIAAVKNDPDNPFKREQLADFYLRTGQYPQALQILQDTMSAPSLDSIWLKTLFWSRIAKPVEGEWDKADVPQGPLAPLAAYFLSLPHGVYWDQAAFAKLPDPQHYLNTRQETLWMQVIAALKNGREETALQLLEQSPFKHTSWAPTLEQSLKSLIAYRAAQRNNDDQAILSIYPKEGDIESPKQLNDLLATLTDNTQEQVAAIPYHLKEFLLSKEAFVLPFIAEGWDEAAIELHAMKTLPKNFPAWITLSIAQTIKGNRDAHTALDFALAQPSSPSLALFSAELALEAGDKQTAFNSLKEIYTVNDSNGRKAALLLGQFLLDHNNIKDAKKALMTHPALANEIAAKEILARIAIQEGDLKKAYKLYLELENDSSEARSFLARKAFNERNWERAKQLTEDLIEAHPDNTVLKDNLSKIIAEQKKRSKIATH